MEEKFIACGGKHTPAIKSPHPKNKVPEELFKGKNGKFYVMCLHCRNYETGNKKKSYIENKESKKQEIITKKTMSDEYSYCPYFGHENIVKSIHPKDKVPIRLFRKDENDPDSKLNINCFDCRIYNTNHRKKYAIEKKQEISSKKQDNTEYSYCPYFRHGTITNSIYPRDKVPIQFFRSDENNPKSHLLENCMDCRKYKNEHAKEQRNIRECKAKEKGLHVCTECRKPIKHEERAINLDDTLCDNCNACKNKEDISIQNRIDIKIDIIKNNQCSCVKCKNLFFKPDGDSIIVDKVPTYETNGNIYAIYNDKEMLVTDIIDLYYNNLELSILELDHLTEDEQRERGLLLEHEKYIPKKNMLSKISGKKSMETEILKCQMLCIFCHVEETIRREKGIYKKYGNFKLKHEYVKKFKDQGCVSCGYVNIDMPRFFDMDHLNPDNKITTISIMCCNSDYILDDVINECTKCRVLCKFCHRIHTVKQQKERLLNKLKYEISAGIDDDDASL
jgi:hypothetical protein